MRFVEDLETFTYSFPCHVCDFETARKTELENHLLRRHEITMSFTHASAKRRRLLTMVETNVNTLPKVCWCSIILIKNHGIKCCSCSVCVTLTHVCKQNDAGKNIPRKIRKYECWQIGGCFTGNISQIISPDKLN